MTGVEMPSAADIEPTAEKPQLMQEVHAPHRSIHTWKDFLVHIAAIALGLLMALCLEKMVEYVHHRHQSEIIESQMRTVFQSNLETDAATLRKLGVLRSYLIQLQGAISDRLQGQALPSAPPLDHQRLSAFVILPGLAPYDAAKANGTVAWLSVNQIRIYNRVAFARELQSAVRDRWFLGLAALEEFQEQFVDSTGTLEVGGSVRTPDLAKLTPAQLAEYLKVVSALIKRSDALAHRLGLLDFEFKEVLDGVPSEEDLVRAMNREFGSEETPAGPAAPN
jgi:hypothetical protein